jgi:hypothetical protein
MSTTFITELSTPVRTADGRIWRARVYGRPLGEVWEGWIEFVAGDGSVATTARETTQPDRRALAYWASGLEPIYLEGALARALDPIAM